MVYFKNPKSRFRVHTWLPISITLYYLLTWTIHKLLKAIFSSLMIASRAPAMKAHKDFFSLKKKTSKKLFYSCQKMHRISKTSIIMHSVLLDSSLCGKFIEENENYFYKQYLCTYKNPSSILNQESYQKSEISHRTSSTS